MPARASTPCDSLLPISDYLRPGDYVLAHLLDDHDVLTVDQIAAVLFSSWHTCRKRLDLLRRLDFIQSFSPIGSCRPLPRHHLPGRLSARYVALSNGEPEPRPRQLRLRQEATAFSRLRDHRVEASQFFIDLLVHARADSQTGLARWWSPERTRRAVEGLAWPHGHGVHPDGHGVWVEGTWEVRLFLEHDDGRSPVRDLMERIERHRQLRFASGPDYTVLMWLPTAERENELRAVLNNASFGTTLAGLTVATSTRDAHAGVDPADALWSVSIGAGANDERRRLIDLPGATPHLMQSPEDDPFDPARRPTREPRTAYQGGLARVLLEPVTIRQNPLYLPEEDA